MSHSRRNLQARNQEVKAFKLNSICRDFRYHFSQECSIHDSFCSFGSGQVTFFASHLKSLLSLASGVSEVSGGFPGGKQGGLSWMQFLPYCSSDIQIPLWGQITYYLFWLNSSLWQLQRQAAWRRGAASTMKSDWKSLWCTSLYEELFGINDPMRALEAVRPVQWKITLFSF